MSKPAKRPGTQPCIVVNRGTESPVSHTESGVDMLWPTRKSAARHAYTLGAEYSLTRPELNELYRTWVPVAATPEQIAKAIAAGAFGEEYADIIGTGQARPDAKGVRDPVTGDGDAEKFQEMLERNGFTRGDR